MLETCENCNGKGKTHDLPPKRCMDCKGKGVVEVIQTFGGPDEELVEAQIDNYYQPLVENFIPEKPWYKKIFS